YHFDEAYHNGDVWVWLTGPVVSAMVKHGLVEPAWEQTAVLRDLIFDEGAAGTLPELRNGVPPEHEENVAGAVSQAWSLAEFVRNFYQDYLGVRPDMLSGAVAVRPALPPSCRWLSAPVRIGKGALLVLHYVDESGKRGCTRLVLSGEAPSIKVEYTPMVPPGAAAQQAANTVEFTLRPTESVELVVEEGKKGWTARIASPEERPVCRSAKD
ncbi:MAG: hypothetical protein JXB46_01715, partial [Candidatus Eisenbacteria bacterium]|nr:hypothetical protein [Candidatus Eisenbacteria bacterium]